jgi:tetratricopeptide (TPR) repeat protein
MKQVNIVIIVFCTLFQSYVHGQTNAFLNAKLAYEKMQFGQCLGFLNQYISDFPKYENAVLLRAKTYLELKSYQLALEDISKLKVSSNNEIYLLLSRAYAGASKNELAIEYLSKYLASNTKLPEPIIKSFPEFKALKLNEGWISLWRTIRYTNKEILINNAIYAIKSGNYAEAADRLDECLAKYPRSAEAFFLRGNVYYNSKDYKAAWDSYENALQIEPKFQECILAKANCGNRLGKYKTSLDLFNSIIQSDSLTISAYPGRAESFVELGNLEQAKSDISKYREYYPENADNQLLEAYIDTKSGDFLSAIANYSKLIKSNPAKPEYFINRANAYMHTKTYKYAIKDYSMALDLEPRNIEVYKSKAKAHQLAGELTQACFEWQHAAKLGDIESMDNLYKYCKNQKTTDL